MVRDHFRAAARQPETMAAPRLVAQIPSTEDLEQALMQAEMSACIGRVLARLPRPQYEVVALYDKAGLTHREIAALLDITPANSRVLLHRALAGLRNLLSERCRLSFDETVPCEPLPGPRSDQGAT